jgi:arabinofuranosyltransferase
VGIVDDAYIFLRYAKNLSVGIGPVFNAGERVEGYTSPLWLVLVRCLFFIASEPASVVTYVSAAWGLATIVLVSSRTGLGALLVAANPAFVFWAWSGMDTALVAFCLTATSVALTRRSMDAATAGWAGIAFAAACLARLDAAILFPIIAGWIYFRPGLAGQRSLRAPIAFAIPMTAVALHGAWRAVYYGTWLPNTAAAKVGVGRDVLFSQGVEYLLPMALVLMPAVWLVCWSNRIHRTLALGLTLAWSAFVVMVGGDFFPYGRFAVPLLPMIAALAAPEGRRSSATVSTAVALLAQVLLLAGLYRTRGIEEVRLAQAWAQTGRWLRHSLPDDATVATLVAGAVPYYSGRGTIDLLGLTDRHIATQGRVASDAYVGHQRYDSDYVLRRRPSVIVLHDSGRYNPARFADSWPSYSGEEWRYVAALQDLVEDPRTREQYVYRAELLPNGRYLEALWLK